MQHHVTMKSFMPFPITIIIVSCSLIISNENNIVFRASKFVFCRSQCSRGLMCRSAAARLLRLRVRISPGAWKSVASVVLSGRGLCDGLITRLEESYRV